MIEAKETAPGNLELTCKVSGKPVTRTNEYGMFCCDPECRCEQAAKGDFGEALKFLFDNFKE